MKMKNPPSDFFFRSYPANEPIRIPAETFFFCNYRRHLSYNNTVNIHTVCQSLLSNIKEPILCYQAFGETKNIFTFPGVVETMPSQPPIPPLLSPYLSNSAHSPQSLTLITSVLAATSNWLALRYLHSVLSISHPSHSSDEHDGEHTGKAKRIVLVSFLRDWSFWKAEGKRLVLLL